jgi:hypothetical protein
MPLNREHRGEAVNHDERGSRIATIAQADRPLAYGFSM